MTCETGSLLDAELRTRAIEGADVVVSTLSPRAAEDGTSATSGADFALAIVDEIQRPKHRRANLSVAC